MANSSTKNHLNHDPSPLTKVTSFVNGTKIYNKEAAVGPKPKKRPKK